MKYKVCDIAVELYGYEAAVVMDYVFWLGIGYLFISWYMKEK